MFQDPLHPGLMYHIYNRGNNKENLFKEQRNYNYFLQLWKRHIVPVADTFCYSLLPNHFHFLIETRDTISLKRIHQSFSNCFNAYTKSINKSYERTGSLFQERFRRKLVEDKTYATAIIYYIHSNAKKHGLINDFRHYIHSSYQSILSSQPTLLCRNRVLDLFGGRDGFIEFHKPVRSSRPHRF